MRAEGNCMKLKQKLNSSIFFPFYYNQQKYARNTIFKPQLADTSEVMARPVVSSSVDIPSSMTCWDPPVWSHCQTLEKLKKGMGEPSGYLRLT